MLVLAFADLSLASERLFVSSFYDNQVNVFDIGSPEQAKTSIEVGVYPNQIASSPAGDAIYVANYTTADISVIDPASLAVINTIDLSCRPYSLDVTSDGSQAYVVCRSTGKVAQVDLIKGVESGQASVTFPYDLALDPQGRFAYVTRLFFSRYLYVVDLESQRVVSTVRVGRSPKGVAVGPNGEFVYVANSNSATVSIIASATNSVVETIAVDSGPNAVAIDKSGSFLYLTHNYSGSVSVIDLASRTMVAGIEVGDAPERLTLSDDGSRLYVANFASNTVSVIDTTQRAVISTVPTGNGPFDVALLEQHDTTPPELILATNQSILWPPNHKLRDIHLNVTATDNQDPAPQVKLVSITSSEPCSASAETAAKTKKPGAASPQSCADIVDAELGSFDVAFKLRAERFAYNGDDRTYSITYRATDAAGNTTTASIDINVPLFYSPR
jgi:YVTN family beta-propeller protein